MEAVNMISIVKRYNEHLSRAYRIICKEAPTMDREYALKAAINVKSVNDSVGPDGLVPTLFVYGAISRFVLQRGPLQPKLLNLQKQWQKQRDFQRHTSISGRGKMPSILAINYM